MYAMIAFVALLAAGWVLRRAFNRFLRQLEREMDGY
jgi:hypothetical protein